MPDVLVSREDSGERGCRNILDYGHHERVINPSSGGVCADVRTGVGKEQPEP